MSDNLSSQFPHPPELQPLAAPQAKGQQIFSSVLIVAGVILLATGGWMFAQYQYEANKPPPARILEVSVANLTETPLPTPSPTKTLIPSPSPTARHSLGDTLILDPTNTQPAPTPTAADTPEPLPPTAEATATPADTSTPEPTSTPEIVPTSAAIATEAPSLADNPLLVEAPADTPTEAEPGPVVTADSPITRIVAESIGLDAPVIGVGWDTQTINGVLTNIWTVADYAAGWHKNSALPGQGGNIVLSAHHNINGEVFRYTIDLNVGDIVTIYEGDQSYSYAVADKFIVKDKGEPDAVRRENAKWIGPFNEERLTLVTCWPFTNNTHRAIVIAKPVQP